MNKVKKIIGNIAAFGSTLSLGVLSFSGMMLITPSLPIAALAFFLAVAIEGAVYRENIFAAMRRLGNQKVMIERAIALRELTKIRKSKRYKKNKFLQDYFNQKEYLHDLKENLAYYSNQDGIVAKRELQRVIKRVEEMEDLFIQCIRNQNHGLDTASLDKKAIIFEIKELLKLEQLIGSEELEKEVKNKKRYMFGSLTAAFAAGTCAGFVTLSSMQTCLLAAGIGLSTATVIAAPIVAFAAFGYTLMMYRTVTDMIQNDTAQKWGAEIRKFWNTPESERKASYYLKAVGVAALVTLAMTATVATAGTWWYLAKAGARIITALPDIGAKIISAASWAFTLVPNFLFNVVNAVKSINKIPGLVKNAFHNMSHGIKETWKEENIIQFLNPFRIVRKILNAGIFIGHLISIAATSDQTPGFNPIASASTNLMMESLTDLHYVVEDKHENEHKHDRYSPHHVKHHHSEAHHHHHHHHDDEHEHHQHGDFFLNKINLFFNYLTIGWDWLFSQNSWRVSKNKFFTIETLPEPKALSPEWVQLEIGSKLDRKTLKYKKKGILNKATALLQLKNGVSEPAQQVEIKSGEIKQQPVSNLQAIHKKITEATDKTQPLAQHRHRFKLFFNKPPQSKNFLEDMLVDKSLQLNR